jgi:hypothetical protein
MSDHFYTTSAAERDYRTACSNLIGQSRDKLVAAKGKWTLGLLQAAHLASVHRVVNRSSAPLPSRRASRGLCSCRVYRIPRDARNGLREFRSETRHCRGVRWCHVAACRSRIGPWCRARAGGLPQLGRLKGEVAPDRTDVASDDRGLCLHNFKPIRCHRTAFPHHSSVCFRRIARIAWSPSSKNSLDLS